MAILKEIRNRIGYTQEDVAKKLDVSVNTIANWEKGNTVTKEWLHRLLDLYGVTKAEREKVVLEVYADDRGKVEEIEEIDNFPYFFYNAIGCSEVSYWAKEVELTREEMEFFLYICLKHDYSPENVFYLNNRDELRKIMMELDYDFMEKYGGVLGVYSILAKLNGIFALYRYSLAGCIFDDFFDGMDEATSNLEFDGYRYPDGFCLKSQNKGNLCRLSEFFAKDASSLSGLSGLTDLYTYIYFCWLFEEPRFLGDSKNGIKKEWYFGLQYSVPLFDECEHDYDLGGKAFLDDCIKMINIKYNHDKTYEIHWMYRELSPRFFKSPVSDTIWKLLDFQEKDVMNTDGLVKEYWLTLKAPGKELLKWAAEGLAHGELFDFMWYLDGWRHEFEEETAGIMDFEYVRKILRHKGILEEGFDKYWNKKLL